jgi:cupin fold WbuC family metalloprotein
VEAYLARSFLSRKNIFKTSLDWSFRIKTRKENQEVFFVVDPIVKIGESAIVSLKDRSTRNPRQRSRLCAHQSPLDDIHEMLIVHHKGVYVQPHMHVRKNESIHIIEGAVDIVIFDQDGVIIDLIEMGDYASGQVFYYRLPELQFHTLLIQSEVLVFHEVTKGPFRRGDTVWAPWAPKEFEIEQVVGYSGNLERLAENFKEEDQR